MPVLRHDGSVSSGSVSSPVAVVGVQTGLVVVHFGPDHYLWLSHWLDGLQKLSQVSQNIFQIELKLQPFEIETSCEIMTPHPVPSIYCFWKSCSFPKIRTLMK
jgi:hypothetical protein